jgi:hypothetical protein
MQLSQSTLLRTEIPFLLFQLSAAVALSFPFVAAFRYSAAQKGKGKQPSAHVTNSDADGQFPNESDQPYISARPSLLFLFSLFVVGILYTSAALDVVDLLCLGMASFYWLRRRKRNGEYQLCNIERQLTEFLRRHSIPRHRAHLDWSLEGNFQFFG